MDSAPSFSGKVRWRKGEDCAVGRRLSLADVGGRRVACCCCCAVVPLRAPPPESGVGRETTRSEMQRSVAVVVRCGLGCLGEGRANWAGGGLSLGGLSMGWWSSDETDWLIDRLSLTDNQARGAQLTVHLLVGTGRQTDVDDDRQQPGLVARLLQVDGRECRRRGSRSPGRPVALQREANGRRQLLRQWDRESLVSVSGPAGHRCSLSQSRGPQQDWGGCWSLSFLAAGGQVLGVASWVCRGGPGLLGVLWGGRQLPAAGKVETGQQPGHGGWWLDVAPGRRRRGGMTGPLTKAGGSPPTERGPLIGQLEACSGQGLLGR